MSAQLEFFPELVKGLEIVTQYFGNLRDFGTHCKGAFELEPLLNSKFFSSGH